jgi:hypothetical protein
MCFVFIVFLIYHESWHGHYRESFYLKLFYVLRDNGLSSNVLIKLVHRGLLDDMCDLFLNTNVSRTVIITGHLHWNLLTQKTRLVRNVTRVKRTSSITSSLIFSRGVISRIYFQWNVISKLYFCDQWGGLHWYVSVYVYTQTSDATGNIGSNLCLRNCVYGLDVPDTS